MSIPSKMLWRSEKPWPQAVEKVVKEKEAVGGTEDLEWFDWLDGVKDVMPVSGIHRRVRHLVEKEATKPA